MEARTQTQTQLSPEEILAQLLESFPPLPEFATAADIRCITAEVLLPPSRITVSEAAAKYRIVERANGERFPWSNEDVGYMVDAMNAVRSPRYHAVIVVAPAQSIKTDSLCVNSIVHAVTCHPVDIMVVLFSQDEAQDFSRRRIDTLLKSSPAVGLRLMPGQRSDNVYTKTFRDMILSLVWPTEGNLSSKSIPLMIMPDFDRLPLDVDGKGDPFIMAQARISTFGSGGTVVAESSPGHPYADSRWKPNPAHPHMAPPTTGILSKYNLGDRRRVHWQCPHCEDYFEPTFATLDWEGKGSDKPVNPTEAAKTTVMVCPNNGCLIGQEYKEWMNHPVRLRVPTEGQTVGPDGEYLGEECYNGIFSLWMFGPVAVGVSWAALVERYLGCKSEYETSGNEAPLKGFYNTALGEPYLSQAARALTKIGPSDLVNRAEDYPLRVIPDWVRFVVVSVDVQLHSFEYMVTGYGRPPDADRGLERTVLDRGTLFQATDENGEDRQLDPAANIEDWRQLFDLLATRYPLADGSGRTMGVLRLVVDSGGKDGVTSNAYDFWREAKDKGLASRIVLAKGDGGKNAKRLRETYPDSSRNDRHAGARGEVPVWLFNTNDFKDQLIGNLFRETRGPGYVHLSQALKDEGDGPHIFFEGLFAETREKNGTWTPSGRFRNEPIDLMNMANVGAGSILAHRIKWSRPPTWATPWDDNPMVEGPDTGPNQIAAPAPLSMAEQLAALNKPKT